MNTISNERLGAFILGSQPWNEEIEQMATELLALRKERDRAEPVATLYKSGKSAKVIMIGADLADGYTDVFAELQTAPPAPVVVDDSLPYDTQIAEYEQMMEAAQDQADTTARRFESLASVKQPSSNLAATSRASRDSDDNSSPDSQTTIKQSDGWIPCRERMPPENTGVLVATEFDGPGD